MVPSTYNVLLIFPPKVGQKVRIIHRKIRYFSKAKQQQNKTLNCRLLETGSLDWGGGVSEHAAFEGAMDTKVGLSVDSSHILNGVTQSYSLLVKKQRPMKVQIKYKAVGCSG